MTGPETLGEDELDRARVDLLESIREHPFDDDYYRERSADWSKVTVPLLTCANWGGQGLHLRGNIEGFVRAASEQKWLECHGLEHWTHFYTDYGRELQRRFFDHFLKGEDNGWDREPPVRLQIRHPGERFVRADRGRSGRLLAHAGRASTSTRTPASLETEVPTAERSVTYPGTGDGVTFWTPPLGEEMEITGPLSSKLFVSSSADDLDVFLVVRVFDPDGERGHLPGCTRAEVADRAGLATRLAPKARPGARHSSTGPTTFIASGNR